MPAQTYNCDFAIVALRKLDIAAIDPQYLPVKFQIVWNWKGVNNRQTLAIAPTEDGTVNFNQVWKITDLAPEPDSPMQINLALWVYTKGSMTSAEYIGLAEVALADIVKSPVQQHRFELMVSGVLSQKVEVEFTLNTKPAGAEEAEAPAAEAPAAEAPPADDDDAAAPTAEVAEEAAPVEDEAQAAEEPAVAPETAAPEAEDAEAPEAEAAAAAAAPPAEATAAEEEEAAKSTADTASAPAASAPASATATPQDADDSFLKQHAAAAPAMASMENTSLGAVAAEEAKEEEPVKEPTPVEAPLEGEEEAAPMEAEAVAEEAPAAHVDPVVVPGEAEAEVTSEAAEKHAPPTPDTEPAASPGYRVNPIIARAQASPQPVSAVRTPVDEQSSGEAADSQPPVYTDDADVLLSTNELRVKIADMLRVVHSDVSCEARAAPIGGVKPSSKEALGANFALPAEAVDIDDLITRMLDEPIADGSVNPSMKIVPTQVMDEVLVGSNIEAYLQHLDIGPNMAHAMKTATGEGVKELLKIPRSASQRVVPDNGAAASSVLHQVQHAACTAQATAGGSFKRLAVYVSEESYAEWSASGVADQLRYELPLMHIRGIPADAGAIDLLKLETLVKEDAQKGLLPACVVARMGCEGAAGFDDIAALAGLCKTHGMWLHVDGPAMYFIRVEEQPAAAALRRIVAEGAANVSLTVCVHEVPGLAKLPGFWVFSAGPDGGRLPPQESADNDLHAGQYYLPTYLRLAGHGLAPASRYLDDRLAGASAVLSAVHDINNPAKWHTAADSTAPAITAKLFTHEHNLWAIDFTLLPFGHPLVLHNYSAVKDQVQQHQISIERINSINKAVYGMLQNNSQFTLTTAEGEGGLVHWQSSIAHNTALEDIQAFLDVVTTAGQNMMMASKFVEKLRAGLKDVEGLTALSRGLHLDPLELLAMYVIPTFCDAANDTIAAKDMEDLNAINANLREALGAAHGGVEFTYLHHEGRGMVAVSLSTRAVGMTSEDVAGVVTYIRETIAKVLTTDATVLRLQEEVLRQGIAVAQKKIEEAAAKESESQGLLSMFGFWGSQEQPTAANGLKFDLKTSTLRKEQVRKTA